MSRLKESGYLTLQNTSSPAFEISVPAEVIAVQPDPVQSWMRGD